PRNRLPLLQGFNCRWNRHTELTSALLSLESEKVELAMAMYHRPAFVEPPPVPDLEKLFRRKVEMLEQSLGDDPTITTQAATILRALIEGIVLHPRKKRGSGKKRATMSIEVYGWDYSTGELNHNVVALAKAAEALTFGTGHLTSDE